MIPAAYIKKLAALTCLLFLQTHCLSRSKEKLVLATLTFIYGKSLVTIHPYTYGYSLLRIREWGEGAPLTIGKFTAIADNVTIFLGGNHRIDWITTYPFCHIHTDIFNGTDIKGHPATHGAVTIGNDVWIGSGVTIMSGVTIGDGAVLATGSVVVKDVEAYSITGGNPAKHIGYRFNEQIRETLQKLRWWDLQINEIKELAHDLCASPNLEKLQYWLAKYRKETL